MMIPVGSMARGEARESHRLHPGGQVSPVSQPLHYLPEGTAQLAKTIPAFPATPRSEGLSCPALWAYQDRTGPVSRWTNVAQG